MSKKIIVCLFVMLLSISFFVGCTQVDNYKEIPSGTVSKTIDKSDEVIPKDGDEEPVHLIYYSIGTPPMDLNMVTEELSRMTLEKINATVRIIFIDWGDYDSRITAIINSGENYDIAYMSDYLRNAKKGVYEPLDDLLKEHGQGILDTINPSFWEGVKVDGKIYGIPTNKEIATPQWWMYPKEIVDKYNIDINSIKTFEDLEPWLNKLKDKEPDWQLMSLDRDFHFSVGYEGMINDVPAVVSVKDDSLKVVNQYEQGDTIKNMELLRKFYKAGYINQDAAIKPPSGLVKNEKIFWKQAQGGPYADIIWSKDKGFPIVAAQVEDAVITTESTRGAIVTISSNSKNKVKAMQFLNLVNTDSDVRNTLGYGIQGLHYEVENNKVNFLDASSNYVVPNYSLGNRFIMYPTMDDPEDLWEEYQKFNDTSVKSPMLGFTPDIDPIKNEIAAIVNVSKEFRPALMTGSVEVEENLAKFNSKLKEAGLEKVINELQEQLDDWKRNKVSSNK